MAFSFSVCFTRSFSITARLVCSFFLFISLFLCSLNHPHIWFGPPTPSTPLHPHTPTVQTPLQQLSNALFWPLRCYLLLLLMLGVPPTDNTHTQTYTHTQTDRQCFSFCFLKVQLLLLISCFVGLTFAYLGLRTEVAKPCAVSPSLST